MVSLSTALTLNDSILSQSGRIIVDNLLDFLSISGPS